MNVSFFAAATADAQPRKGFEGRRATLKRGRGEMGEGHSRRRLQAKRPFNSKTRGHGRDARATNGGPPSPELRRGTRGERNVPFYQTNPPFVDGFFDGSYYEQLGC